MNRLGDRFAVLRHRAFRRMWLAHAMSTIGDRMILVVLALYVTQLSGSPTAVGAVMASHAIPLVALLILGGAVADRTGRARVIVVADVVRGVVQAVIAAVVIIDVAEVWHLIVAAAMLGSAEAFARPASTGLAPETVPADEIQEARALLTLNYNAAEIGGPALGTALVLVAEPGIAFALDAATFVVSAVLLSGLALRRSDRPRAVADPVLTAGPSSARSFAGQVRDGWSEFTSRTWLWATVLGTAVALMTGFAPLVVLGPTIAANAYGDPSYYGLLITALGVGSVIGAILGLRLRPRYPLRSGLLLFAIWPVVVVGFAIEVPIGLVLLTAIGGGVGLSLCDVWWNTSLAREVPPQALSRVSAFDWMGSLALLPVGYAAAGPIADLAGPRWVLIVGGFAAIAATVGVLASRQARDLSWGRAIPAGSAPTRRGVVASPVVDPD